MSEELFDVVDELDQVVEVRTRSDVHRHTLRHRAVHIFLFRSDGRMLVHLRTAHKEEFPSVWTSSASGHVSSGESYALSAERELAEELGVQAPLRRFGKFPACNDTSQEFTELYLAESDAEITADPQEIADVRWMTPSDVEHEMLEDPKRFSPSFRLLFTTYQQH